MQGPPELRSGPGASTPNPELRASPYWDQHDLHVLPFPRFFLSRVHFRLKAFPRTGIFRPSPKGPLHMAKDGIPRQQAAWRKGPRVRAGLSTCVSLSTSLRGRGQKLPLPGQKPRLRVRRHQGQARTAAEWPWGDADGGGGASIKHQFSSHFPLSWLLLTCLEVKHVPRNEL